MEAYQKKLRVEQNRSTKNFLIAFQAKKGEPWQPIASSSPIFKFVCNQSSWFNALNRENGPATLPISINQTVLAREGFSFTGAFSVPPQDLFAYAWNQVWTDGARPAQWKQARPGNARSVLKPPLPDYLITLAKTDGISSRHIGVAAAKSPLYSAFEQALEAGSVIRPEIDWLMSEGTTAGRIHGAVLLLHLDPKAGRQALEEMRSDQTMILESSGCLMMPNPVSTIVTEILQGQSVLPIPKATVQ